MSIYFLDSSAVLKRYINETGTEWILQHTAKQAGNYLFISQVTGVEVASAIARRQKQGDLLSNNPLQAIEDFQADFDSHYILLEVSLQRVREAMLLTNRHGLRGYDAVQLAMALHLHHQCQATNLSDPILISADMELNQAAVLEGLTVFNPNQY